VNEQVCKAPVLDTSVYLGNRRQRSPVGLTSSLQYLCFTKPAEPVAGEVKQLEFHTASPAISAKDYWVTINQQDTAYAFSSVSFKHSREEFIRHHNAVPVPDGFHYSSDNNTEWETVETMRENIKKYVDPNFEVK
jgi:hypothetical protein